MSIDIFTNQGAFLMLALDHRDSLKKLLAQMEQDVSDRGIVAFKRTVLEGFADCASGLLLDCLWGLPAYRQYSATGVGEKPYLLSIEKSGYQDQDGEHITELLYTVTQLKEQGASGVKLLLYINPKAHSLGRQLATAKQVVDASKEHELPLFIEIITYAKEGETTPKKDSIIASLHAFLAQGIVPDVFKLEYPGNASACQDITMLLEKTPWILLTKGVSFAVFKQQLHDAITGGARGFLAGRSLWQDFPKEQEAQVEFFKTTARKRFEEIAALATS